MNSTTSIFDLANRFARSKQLLSWDDDNNIRELNSLDLLNPLTPSYLICLDVVNEARKKERGLTSAVIRWFILSNHKIDYDPLCCINFNQFETN